MFLQTKGNCTIIALFELGFIAIYLINAFKEIRQFKETLHILLSSISFEYFKEIKKFL